MYSPSPLRHTTVVNWTGEGVKGSTKLWSGTPNLLFVFFFLSAWVGYPAVWTSTKRLTTVKFEQIKFEQINQNPKKGILIWSFSVCCSRNNDKVPLKTHPFFFNKTKNTSKKTIPPSPPPPLIFKTQSLRPNIHRIIYHLVQVTKPIKQHGKHLRVPPTRESLSQKKNNKHILYIHFKSPEIISSATRRPTNK